MKRNKVFWFVLAAIAVYIGFLAVAMPENIRSLVNSRDRSRCELVFSAYNDIYAKTGVVFTSLREFEHSYYFPYEESYSFSEKGMRYKDPDILLKIDIRHIDDSVEFCGLRHERGKIEGITVSEPLKTHYSQLEITRLRAQLYSSGVGAVRKHFESIRDVFLNSNIGSRYTTVYEDHFHLKPLPACSVVNLPQTSDELKAYTAWLAVLWGTEQLVDGEGKPFVFFLRNGRLYVESQK